MAVRTGMQDLISQFRSSIQESGTAIFTDERIQQILDSNSQQLLQVPLRTEYQYINGTISYTDYFIDCQWLEGTATSTVRVYNSQGTAVTNYASDFINGQFTFDQNTLGTAYYFSGKSFNFYKAVSEAWNEKAAYYSNQFDFTVEGRSYKKSQVVQQCKEMANLYGSKASVVLMPIDRGDVC